jgi:hypothetical protein
MTPPLRCAEMGLARTEAATAVTKIREKRVMALSPIALRMDETHGTARFIHYEAE